MLVSELLLKKSYLEDKVSELKRFLLQVDNSDYKTSSDLYNNILNELFVSIEKLRSYNIVLDKHGFETTIKVGTSDVTLNSAVRLLNSLEDKLTVMTDIINSGNVNINMLDFIDQREKVIEEYLLVVKAIKQSDWSSEIN